MSSLKVSINMASNTLKPRANADTVSGRHTLKDVDRFRNGSVRELYERSLYEQAFNI